MVVMAYLYLRSNRARVRSKTQDLKQLCKAEQPIFATKGLARAFSGGSSCSTSDFSSVFFKNRQSKVEALCTDPNAMVMMMMIKYSTRARAYGEQLSGHSIPTWLADCRAFNRASSSAPVPSCCPSSPIL